jgi:hypothetical protein
LELFRGSGGQLREEVQQLARELVQLWMDVGMLLHQVEEECARIRFQRMLREIHKAAELAVRHAAALAIEKGLRAAAPLPRGGAGGLARARTAWRYNNGTFVPEVEKFEVYRQEYERYAAGGRVRAARTLRTSDGTFLP